MEFVDREEELRFLQRMVAREGAQLLVVWGRRRVGKTALLQQFSKTRRVLYHLGTLSTERLELQRLSARAAEVFDDSLLRAQPLSSWEAALAWLGARAEAEGEAFIVVFDEFPHLVESSPRLPSLLQAAWDERLGKTGIKLVLCGSSMSMMESTFFSPRAPLFGRRTGQWKLEPFGNLDPGCGQPDPGDRGMLRQ